MAEASYDVANALNTINSNLGKINDNVIDVANCIDSVHGSVNKVEENVKIIYSEIGQLTNEFREYVESYKKAARKQEALTKVVSLKQDLEKQFGHHDTIRRHTKGILDAAELELVRGATITTATEEMFLDAPNYWLAPCLVALAAWINNQPELADKAVREALRRDDEKTSLFFALICRRAGRNSSCLKWVQRYLAYQNEEDLDRECIIILDAFASGLLGADSEGVVVRQMGDWMEFLSLQPGFTEQQTKQWSEAIELKKLPYSSSAYTHLSRYSKTWPQLVGVMEGACLHATILSYFQNIFNQEASTEPLKAQLDEILMNLVTGFDDAELPLRQEVRYEELIIEFGGDDRRAQSNMAVEKTAFEAHKDFTQLLTDAAMKPESSGASVSTQKFAIALSRDWIANAYSGLVAKNRASIPRSIQINIDNFNDQTMDGQNENELIGKFGNLVESERAAALLRARMSGFEQFCLWGGAAIGVIGIIAIVFGQIFLGLLAIVGGTAFLINHFSKKKKHEEERVNIERNSASKYNDGSMIIRAVLAEVVDFMAEFRKRDSIGQSVAGFLDHISPDKYVRSFEKLSNP